MSNTSPNRDEQYGPEETCGFATSEQAWQAFRLFDDAGDMAGYPSLQPEANGLYSVRVRLLRR